MHVEYRWQAKDGRYGWIQDNAMLVRDDNGEPKEIIWTWLDITERKQAEERLKVLSSVVEQSTRSIAIW
ncbi:MAG: PAS domain-containing protein [Deltaproteobacteria bacterium]|nr:PAS domain-containing protein [Deltaproteobacteria bacterium]